MASTMLAEPTSPPSSDHRLSLCVDVPPSSSPFPSPSSSFIPPPVPGVHEFALKIPPGRSAKKSADKDQEKQKAMEATAKVNGSSRTSSGGKPGHTKGDSTSSTDSAASSAVLSPSTPTPTPSQLPSVPHIQTQQEIISSPATTPTKSTITIPSPSALQDADKDGPPQKRESLAAPSHRDSLTSSRPAPPSPSISRRASAAPSTSSTHSSKSRPSRPSSTANLSRANSKRKSGASTSIHRLSQRLSQLPSISTPPQQQPQQQPRSSGTVVAIKIRDFAFPTTDPRHTGLGPDVPKPNKPKVLNKKLRGGADWRRTSSGALSTASSTTDDSDEDDDRGGEDEDDGDDGGWGGFKFGVGRFSWGPSFSAPNSARRDADGDRPAGSGEGYPSLNELRDNFDNDDDDEEDDDEGFYDADEGYDDEEDGSTPNEDAPLYPGLYRALYAFEPEGTAEMALEEDQIVRVVGRGGGVGWAVVEQGYVHGAAPSGGANPGGHALVPESYLEAYQLDEVADDQ